MCENVNINVSETNETINIVSSEIQEVIDINVFETTEDVTLNITEEIIQVNINKVTAAEQIQSDWNQTDIDALDFIKNKPTSTSDFINDGENGVNPFITAADVTPQVNSDWNATSGVAEILNKPTIPAAVTKTSDLTNDGEDGINPFITAADIPPVTGFVPYTGATSNVDLGTHTLSAKDLVINHSSGSGVAASITKGGAGEALTINKTSGSGNAMSVTGGVTQLDELHLTTDLADAYIASAATWNGKFTLPALTSGSVLFSNGTTIAQDNSNLFWDDTNNRLGIGTSTPNSRVNALDGTVAELKFNSGLSVLTPTLAVGNTGGTGKFAALIAGTVGTGFVYDSLGYFDIGIEVKANYTNNTIGNPTSRMRISTAGNVLIGTTTDAGFKLYVNGTVRLNGSTTTQSILPVTTQTYNIGSGTSQFSTIYSNVFQSNGTSIIRSGASSNLIFQANGGTEVARFTTGLNLLVGTTTNVASSKLTIESTTQGFLPPRMTNAQKLAIATPAAGLVVYDTTLNKLCVRTASSWETITSI